MKHGRWWKIAPGQEETVKLVLTSWGKTEATGTHIVPLLTIEQDLSDEEGGGETFESVRYFQVIVPNEINF